MYRVIVVILLLLCFPMKPAAAMDTSFIDNVIDSLAGVGESMFDDITSNGSGNEAYLDDMMAIGEDTFKGVSEGVELGDSPADLRFKNPCLSSVQTAGISQKSYKACLVDAKNGSPLAQLYVGMYLYRTDPAQAKYWLKLAANNDMAMGHDLLGNMYALGNGTKEDMGKAFYHYLEASKTLPKTQKKLHALYVQERKKHVSNSEHLVQYIETLAEAGYAPAQYELGMIYFTGKSPFVRKHASLKEIDNVYAYMWLYLSVHNVFTDDDYKKDFHVVQKQISAEERKEATEKIQHYLRQHPSYVKGPK